MKNKDNKHGYMHIHMDSTVGDNLYKHAGYQLNAIRNTGKCRSLSNGDFSEEEKADILADLRLKYPNCNFRTNDTEEK